MSAVIRRTNLSGYAKKAEDSLAAARKDTHDKVVAMRDQSREAASAAIEKVDRGVKSAGDAAAKGWTDFQAKVAANVKVLDANIAQRKHDRTVRRTEDHAARLEDEASFAIDYAVASIEEARLAVLDAIIARLDSEAAKAS